MLGLDRDAAELAGLITGEEQNPSRPFCVAFEHPACLRFSGLIGETASLPSIIRHSLCSGRCLTPAVLPRTTPSVITKVYRSMRRRPLQATVGWVPRRGERDRMEEPPS